MAIDNVQLARTIGAMYRCTNGGDGDWTDTDEAIQQAAFKLWESHTCSNDEAAVLLHTHTPLDAESVADFLDMPVRDVADAIADARERQNKAMQRIQDLRDDLYADMEIDIQW